MSTNLIADEELDRLFELSLLYDTYGALLKEQKKAIFEDYVLNNLSLGEIAEEVGMTRQGVRDTVVRCTKELKKYEEQLHFLEKKRALSDIFDAIEDDCSDEIKIQVTKARELLEG